MFWLPVMLLLCVALGVAALWFGWDGLGVVRQLIARRTSRIADIQEGPIEVAGVVSVEGPVVASTGEPCALIQVEITHSWETGSGKHSKTTWHSRSRTEKAQRVTLDDGSGVCALSLKEGVTVLAFLRCWSMDIDDFRREFPRDCDLLGPVSRGKVERYERRIEAGQRALVSGVAWPDPDSAPKGYRQGAGDVFFVGGSRSHTLLVVARGQNAGVLRAGLPAALVILGGLVLLGFCAWYGSIYVAAR